MQNLVKRLQDIMRMDAGIDGDAQRISQMTWIFFLKIYDSKEEEWKLQDDKYESIIPEELRWKNWAVDDKSSNTLTGEKLLDLVNNKLFVYLKNLPISKETPLKQSIVKYVFDGAQNYMKDGVLLRQVINVINEIDFSDWTERNNFGEIYESILKSLQSSGNAGEFYTPRAVTDFIVKVTDVKLGETVADFACGTGGFLTSALKHLEQQKKIT